jgi:F-type H+-transporting ATPase subunit epsilon
MYVGPIEQAEEQAKKMVTALEAQAEFVVVPLFDGELGIGPGHTPLIGRLGYGELRLRQAGGQTQRYYVDGGFVQVANNVVTVLTGRLVSAEKLDAQAARELLQSAMQRPVHTPELLQLRDRIVDQARSQIRTAERVGR